MPYSVYRAQEAELQFSDTDGDHSITLNNLNGNSGRISDRVDRGLGSLPIRYKWRASIQFQSSGLAALQQVDILLSQSDGNYADGSVATVDSIIDWHAAANMEAIGDLRVQSATANVAFVASGFCWVWDRYFQVGVFDYAGKFRDSDNASRIIMTPMPRELQD